MKHTSKLVSQWKHIRSQIRILQEELHTLRIKENDIVTKILAIEYDTGNIS